MTAIDCAKYMDCPVVWKLIVQSAECRLTAGAAARRQALAMGFGKKRAAEIEIVAAELAGNIFKHAKTGMISVKASPDGVLLIDASDNAGMIDARDFEDGYSRSHQLLPEETYRQGGIGAGLGAVKRLSDAVSVISHTPGKSVIAAFRVEESGAPHLR